MDTIDWSQFQTLAILFAGIYIIFEVVRIGVERAIKIYGGVNFRQTLYNVEIGFLILRIALLAFFAIFFVFTAVFNRHEVAVSHGDLGHQENIEAIKKIDPEQLKASIMEKQQQSQNKSLSEVNSESEKDYEDFLKQNSAQLENQ